MSLVQALFEVILILIPLDDASASDRDRLLGVHGIKTIMDLRTT